jgi:L-lactate dehydrogenase (cytochrome)
LQSILEAKRLSSSTLYVSFVALSFASKSNKTQGKDATEAYEPIHPPDTLDKFLDASKHLGPVDMSTVQQETKQADPEEEERLQRVEQKPLLSQCYNLFDFEAVARRVMSKIAWGYYSSAADDEIVCWTQLAG